jgi:predicted nucleic acid-binding protein
MIIIDTSILVDHLRGRPEPGKLMREAMLSGVMIAASVLTRVELLGAMRSAERPSVRATFAALDWLGVTEEIADRAGSLARAYQRSHGSIDVVDYVIAATAHEYEADLWTRNLRHFPMIKGLVAPY